MLCQQLPLHSSQATFPSNRAKTFYDARIVPRDIVFWYATHARCAGFLFSRVIHRYRVVTVNLSRVSLRYGHSSGLINSCHCLGQLSIYACVEQWPSWSSTFFARKEMVLIKFRWMGNDEFKICDLEFSNFCSNFPWLLLNKSSKIFRKWRFIENKSALH